MIKNGELSPEEAAKLFQQQKQQTRQPDKQQQRKSLTDTLFFHTAWQEAPLTAQAGAASLSGHVLLLANDPKWQAVDESIILVTPGESFADMGQKRFTINPAKREDYSRLIRTLYDQQLVPQSVVHMWSEQAFDTQVEAVQTQLTHGFSSMILLTQALMEQKPKHKTRLLYVYTRTTAKVEPLYAAVSGFLKTLGMENPNFLTKMIELDSATLAGNTVSRFRKVLAGELAGDVATEAVVRYEEGTRSVRVVQEYVSGAEAEVSKGNSLSLKKHGVYLITGGAGGLGLIFATHLARKAQARLVLVGRSALQADQQAKLNELEQAGAEVLYLQADMTSRTDVESVIAQTKARFTELNGIIHSAGVIRDAFILQKTQEEVTTVLAPKVFGTLHLDEATKNEALDFFVLFSSTTAVMGNIGQSDYAFANRFMDEYAAYREQLGRPGVSLALNWPYWQEGGMRVTDEAVEAIESKFGVTALPTENGIHAFETGLVSGLAHMMTFQGDAGRIRQMFAGESEEKKQAGLATRTEAGRTASKRGADRDGDATGKHTVKAEPTAATGKKSELAKPPASAGKSAGLAQPTPADHSTEPAATELFTDATALKAETELFLKNVLAQEIKLPINKIDVSEPLEKYGIDSVMVVNLNRELERHFGELSKTLLFEYQNLSDLADYFIDFHIDKLRDKLQPKASGGTGGASGKAAGQNKTGAGKNSVAQTYSAVPTNNTELTESRAPHSKSASNPGAGQRSMASNPSMAGKGATGNRATGNRFGTASTRTTSDNHNHSTRNTANTSTKNNRNTQSTADTTALEPIHTYNDYGHDDIAIIGMSGRFPMARTIDEFWENLKAGKDCISEIPSDRWDANRDYDPDKTKKGKVYSKWGGFIDDVDKFDPLFFNISPREAETMDPQERLFLETVWHTLEDAGYTKSQLDRAAVGVFVGVMYGQYQLYGAEESMKGNLLALSSSYASVANRVSYFFNFHGPSIAIDTMCSSSLTAIHLACESLRRGESEVAIAGGVNVSIHPNKYVLLSQGKFASTDGRCRSFGEGGDGYVPGEGVGAVLLKPLEKAIADGDNIYAVVKGTSVNHGGKTNGYTVPNPVLQASLISDALRRSGVNPRTISYIEAHGTGTSLGDPIEMTGLIKSFGEYTRDKQFCSIGSAKSNIGHLESAAGVAGVIKVLLQMKYRQLVPSIHSDTLNPNINFDQSPFYVQKKLTEWNQPVVTVDGEEQLVPLRAGISSFGAGGSNAHVILEAYEQLNAMVVEAQTGADADDASAPQLIVLSAKNEERLKEYASKLAGFLKKSVGKGLGSAQSDESAGELGQKNPSNATTRNGSTEQQPLSSSEPAINDEQLSVLFKVDLQTTAAHLLNIHTADLDPTVDLGDYGFDGITLAKLAERLNETYGLELTAALFADYGSIEAITGYLSTEAKDRLLAHYSNPVSAIAEASVDSGVSATIEGSADSEASVYEASVNDTSGTVANSTTSAINQPPSLADIAYTLQTSREPMEERLALVVSSMEELIAGLEAYVTDSSYHSASSANSGIYAHTIIRGNTEQGGTTSAVLSQEEEDVEYLHALIRNGNLEKVARFWVVGSTIDWGLLHSDQMRKHVALPGYPFARERYWVPQATGDLKSSLTDGASTNGQFPALHPLVDLNQSTLASQVFKKTLHSHEYVIQDHIVNGQAILPGAAYLEMVRAAAELAGLSRHLIIQDVFWMRPVVVDGMTKDVYIELSPDTSFVTYEVYSIESEQKITHSTGRILYQAAELADPSYRVDVAEIKQRFSDRRDKQEVYQILTQMGFGYGTTFQVTQEMFGGTVDGLVRLQLAEQSRADFAKYVLHPSLLDGALRSVGGIGLAAAGENQVLRIPFAVGQVEIYQPMTAECYAYAIRSTHPEMQDGDTEKYDIVIFNEAGEVLVRINDFSARPLQRKEQDLLYFRPVWQQADAESLEPSLVSVEAGGDAKSTVLVFDEETTVAESVASIYQSYKSDASTTAKQVIRVSRDTTFRELGDNHFAINPANPQDYETLLTHLHGTGIIPTQIVHLWSLRQNGGSLTTTTDFGKLHAKLDESLENGLYSIMYLFQAVTSLQSETKTKCLFVYPGTEADPMPQYEALAGFAKSIAPVNYRFELVTVQIETGGEGEDGHISMQAQLPTILFHELNARGNSNGTEIRYARGDRNALVETRTAVRYVRVIEPISLPAGSTPTASHPTSLPLRTNGVYLITGGIGGLGMIFARYLAENYQARLVLTGRSALNADRQAKIDELKQLGAEVVYSQADVSSASDVQALITTIKNQFGTIHGIIHSAGVTNDVPVTQQDRAAFAKVLSSKIQGSLNLDLATRDEQLGFFVLFSSIAALMGDFGGCSYATANSFLDSFAAMREQQQAKGLRYGRTLAINWPLWAGGGMDLPEQDESAKLYFEYSGMRALTPELGLQAFTETLASGLTQVVVASGNQQKINRVLKTVVPAAGSAGNVSAAFGDSAVQAATVSGASAQAGLPQSHGTHTSVQAQAVGTPMAQPTGLATSTLAIPATTGQSATPATSTEASFEDRLSQATEAYLKDLLSETIGLPASRIDAKTNFDRYGIDSVMIMELNNRLEKEFQNLPKTLFFEYSNIADLGKYLVKNQAARLKEMLNVPAEVEQAGGVVAENVTNAGIQQTSGSSVAQAGLRPSQAIAGITPITAPQTTSPVAPASTAIPSRFAPKQPTATTATQAAPASTQPTAEYDDIAIIGVSGMYPQARNLEEYWNNLKNGRDCISEIPRERWNHDPFFDPEKGQLGKTYTKWGGFLNDVDKFDPLFFHISPLEAELMDPQERLFIQTVWHTIEDAGYTRQSLSNAKAGVYVGVMYGQYQLYAAEQYRSGNGFLPLSAFSSIANRVSYLFNFTGPSLALDTACSSSMTAIHLACESLRRGEIDVAIAGGVNLTIHPLKYLQLSIANFFSSDGKCRSFGDGGDGYVPGEGVGAVLLKPLKKAVADGDRIYGVIKASSINHGGRTNGYSVPSPNAQGELVTETLQKANIDPRTISYFEAQATGTPLGDSIEIAGLGKAFGQFTQDKQYCAIGTAKSMIGHLESASGIAGLTKVLLQMKHKQIAPSLHSEVLNPNIDFANSPFVVQQTLTDWNQPVINGVTYPRRAGISSYGAGGANAHLIVEEYIPPVTADNAAVTQTDALTSTPQIILLSARDEDRLQAYAQEMAAFLNSPEADALHLADIAYTLQVGREAMEERLALLVTSVAELRTKLADFAQGGTNIHNLYGGNIETNREKAELLVGGTAGEEFIRHTVAARDYTKLAQLWVLGVEIDWALLYPTTRPGKIALPVYPFAKLRYWVPEVDVTSYYGNHPTQTVLHTARNQAAATIQQTASATAVTSHPAEQLSPQERIQLTLQDILCSLLKLPAGTIKVNDNLRKYGFDSLTGMRMINTIHDMFDVKISAKELFTFNNIQDVAKYLVKEGAQLEEAAATTATATAADTTPTAKTFPLTEGQRAVWVVHQLKPDNSAYNLPFAVWISNELNIEALQQALRYMQQRHEGLRTTVQLDGERPVQTVHAEQPLSFVTRTATEATIDALAEDEARQPFDLEKGPLMRATLYTLARDRHLFLMNFHHLVFDGVSLPIFIRELEQVYLALIHNRTPQLPELTVSYQDYVAWQQRMLQGKEGQRQRTYWHKQLSGELPLLELPSKPFSGAPTYRGAGYITEVDAELTRALHELALSANVPMFSVMLAAYNILLSRYGQQDDILVGTPMMARPRAEYEGVLGYFANVTVIRSNLADGPAFLEFAKTVNDTVLDALDHSDYPLFTLMQELEKGSDGLFQASFHFQNWVKESLREQAQSGAWNIEVYPHVHQSGEFNFTLEVGETAETMTLYFKYNPDLFEAAIIERMAAHYLEILKNVVKNPAQPVTKVPMLTESEQHKLFVEWNDTTTDYPNDKCIHELIEEQAALYPDKIATVCMDDTITYRELSLQSTRLGHYLQQQGIKPGVFVGIFLERSIDCFVAMLGVSKAGGTYVPLDPTYPSDRLAYMLEDTKAPILITHSSIEDKVPTRDLQILRLDVEWQAFVEANQREHGMDYVPHVPNLATSEDLIYVIYTSGSTGKPKGVQIRHKSLVNLLCSMQKSPGFTHEDYMLSIASYSFDMSVPEIYLALVSGGTNEILPTHISKDGLKLKAHLEQSKATVIPATPAMWQMLLTAEWGATHPFRIFTGGEALSRDLADRLHPHCTEMWNQFGPTETTVWSTMSLVQAGEKINIGRPIANTTIYVLDRHMNPVPIGVPGELYIGGDGVARGYLNREEDNQKKFIDNPFDPDGGKIYRTGDLIRYLPDGNLDYVNRADNLVKIRGYRIELGEIETALQKIKGVKEAVAVVREDNPGAKQLVAYVVLEPDAAINGKSHLRDLLKEWLPQHMMPSLFVVLHSFPLTPSRKIDRKLLTNEKMAEINGTYGDKDFAGKDGGKKAGKAGVSGSQAGSVPSVESVQTIAVAPTPAVESAQTIAVAPTPVVEPALTFAAAPTPATLTDTELRDFLTTAVEADIIAVIAELIAMEAEDIETDIHIGEYGFDSVSFVNLSVKLKNTIQAVVSPAQFYEYSTIEMLTRYLVDDHREQLIAHYAAKISELELAKANAEAAVAPTMVSNTNVTTVQSADSNTNLTTTQPTTSTNATTYHPHAGNREPIAIIGMAGKMPQSEDLDAYWNNILAGKDMVTEIPRDRWDWRQFDGDATHEENKSSSRWGGFLDDVDKFDSQFFSISRREAELMDPQQRLFLETTWKTIEDAGYKPSDYSGSKMGVFVGVTGFDYMDVLRESGQSVEGYTVSGVARTVIANRVSYLLNLTGPSECIDTACSSSLIAIHRAVLAIQNGDCDTAIAGGVNLLLSPLPYIALSQNGMMSRTGRCRAFDEAGDGYVRGEGVGAILLKPLSKAQADGDHIYAVIRSTAENHGGRSNSLSAPNANAQAELIVKALEDGQVDPATVTYIETHGTGTSLGDPIEINGLKKAFGELFQRQGRPAPTNAYCGLASVKTNIGHLEGAAGIAGVLKVLLAMKHKQLPANIHFNTINPYIQLENTPFYVVQNTTSWNHLRDQQGQLIPLRAGVSSFGFGGANAHVLLEEYIQPKGTDRRQAGSHDSVNRTQVVPLSAKNEGRLKAYATDLAHHLAKTYGFGGADHKETANRQAMVNAISEPANTDLANTDLAAHMSTMTLENIAYTLQTGREALDLRVAFIVNSERDLYDKLQSYVNGNQGQDRYEGNTRGLKAKDIPVFGHFTTEEADLHRAAQAWSQGAVIDWSLLYTDGFPQRISLPTYPFAKTRYWAAEDAGTVFNNYGMNQTKASSDAKAQAGLQPQAHGVDATAATHGAALVHEAFPTAATHGQRPYLHPLVGENVSNLRELAFSTSLSGHEYFLQDYLQDTQPALPAMIYLEMARAAGQIAGGQAITHMENFIWAKPIPFADTSKTVGISLLPVGDEQVEEIDVEIYTDKSGQRYVLCQGTMSLHQTASEMQTQSAAAFGTVATRIDLDAIRNSAAQMMDGDACYRMLAAQGFIYGPSFSAIRQIWSSHNNQNHQNTSHSRTHADILTRLELPSTLTADSAAYTLHPVLLDGVLQTTIIHLAQSHQHTDVLYTPYSLDSLTIKKPLPSNCYAHVSETDGEEGLYTFHVNITDETGEVLAILTNFTVKATTHTLKALREMNDDELLTFLKRVESGEADLHEVEN